MSRASDAIEQFYQYAKDECAISDELNSVLVRDEVKIEFYNLCKRFADISLNALKFKNGKSGEIMGVFQFSDIEKVKHSARDFYLEHQLRDIEGYMESIHKVHRLAVEWDDGRRKAGLVQSETYNHGEGLVGYYYNFQELPEDIWMKICNEIKESILHWDMS